MWFIRFIVRSKRVIASPFYLMCIGTQLIPKSAEEGFGKSELIGIYFQLR